MVNVVSKINNPASARLAAQKKQARPSIPGVRVEPRDDDMRRLLKHPRAGHFRSSGSIEWPNDRFTQRRLREGSIKLASKEAPKEAPKERQERPQH